MIGIVVGRGWLRRRKGHRLLAGMLGLGFVVVLIGGCGQQLAQPGRGGDPGRTVKPEPAGGHVVIR